MDIALDAPIPPVEASPKRRQIVAAAEDLFFAHGYGAVSMDAIARSAGVSKATLYAHFASKDVLFAGIMAEKGREAPDETEIFSRAEEDPRVALIRIGQRVLRFMLRPRTLDIYRLAIAESTRFPELGRTFHEAGPQRLHDRFRAWVVAEVEAGRLSAPDPTIAAHQFMALIRSGGFLRASLALPPPPDDAEIDATVDAAVATFLRAFGRPGAG